MATIRERTPGVWEVRVFLGRDERGRPKQVSRTVRGTKRTAPRAAAVWTVTPPPVSEGHTVADALDVWVETNTPTWAASTVRDQASRAKLVKAAGASYATPETRRGPAWAGCCSPATPRRQPSCASPASTMTDRSTSRSCPVQ